SSKARQARRRRAPGTRRHPVELRRPSASPPHVTARAQRSPPRTPPTRRATFRWVPLRSAFAPGPPRSPLASSSCRDYFLNNFPKKFGFLSLGGDAVEPRPDACVSLLRSPGASLDGF